MTSKTIMFKNPDNMFYLGRNGTGYCKGVEIWAFGTNTKEFIIQPINSKGDSARCKIEIPREDTVFPIQAIPQQAK